MVFMFMLAGSGFPRLYFSKAPEISGCNLLIWVRASSFEKYVALSTPSMFFKSFVIEIICS